VYAAIDFWKSIEACSRAVSVFNGAVVSAATAPGIDSASARAVIAPTFLIKIIFYSLNLSGLWPCALCAASGMRMNPDLVISM
jgi:hypothetical protein